MKNHLILIFIIIFGFITNNFADDNDDFEDFEIEELSDSQNEKTEKTPEPPVKEENKTKPKINISRPQLEFDKNFLETNYKNLYLSLEKNYVPNVVLSNIANDLEYSQGESSRFLDAMSFLDRSDQEKFLSFYDDRESTDYKRLIVRIIRKKKNRPDIPHANIFREAIQYRYARAKPRKREQILLRIGKLNTVQTKDLSSYSLDELIKEIELRGWTIKLEKLPSPLRNLKQPVI